MMFYGQMQLCMAELINARRHGLRSMLTPRVASTLPAADILLMTLLQALSITALGLHAKVVQTPLQLTIPKHAATTPPHPTFAFSVADPIARACGGRALPACHASKHARASCLCCECSLLVSRRVQCLESCSISRLQGYSRYRLLCRRCRPRHSRL